MPARAGLLLTVSLALASLGSHPAAADCTGTTVVTCASPGTGGFVAATDGVAITVLPGATVIDDGTQAISINNSSSVANGGTIKAITDNSSGILVNGNNNTIVNNGAITASGVQTIAVNVQGTGNTVLNSGTITASGGPSLGILSNNGGNQITNAGTIIVSGFSDPADLSVGIVSFTGDVVTNSGTILVTSADAVGIDALNGQPTTINTGTIIASGAQSFGIQTGGDAVAVNSGLIVASGAGAVGVRIQGNFTGALTDPPSFTNNGTILATGTGAFALTTRFSSAYIVNNGLIDGRIFSANNGGGDLLVNNGTIQVSNGAFVTHSLVNGGGGTFQQNASGTLALRVNSAGADDKLRADFATLAGTLRAVVQPGLYGAVTVYAGVIQTGCGCVGNFDRAVSSSPFFTAVSTSDATNVDLTLTRIAFNAVPGLTRNQSTVANALEPLYSTALAGNAATLFGNLLAATSVSAFDQLSGQGTAAMQTASINAGTLFNNAMQGQALFGDLSGATVVTIPPVQYAATPKPRGQDAFASLNRSDTPAAPAGRWRIWTLGFGAYRSVDGNAFPTGSASQIMRSFGGAIGVDHQISPDLLVGFAAGGSAANISVSSLSTTGQITAGHLGIYGVKTWGSYYASAAASYARLDNSTTRNIVGIGPSEVATGKFASDQLSARFELGWKQAFAYYTLTPFVAIEPAALWAHAYSESSTIIGGGSGILGLTFAARTTTSLPTFVGMQVDTRTVFSNGSILTPYARASWVHEFEPNRQVNAAFVNIPAAAFTVDGARVASDAARVDAGVKYALDPMRSLFTNVSGEWSNVGHSVSATAGFKLIR